MPQTIKPLIFWPGIPVCGLLLKKLTDEYGEEVILVATKTQGTFIEIEAVLEHKIIWLDNANDIWEHKERLSDRNLIIHTGWIYTGWLKYDAYMKKHNNIKVIVAVDNRYRGDIRQYIGALWFRLYLKRYFDGALVPGKEGIRLMQFLGMKKERIYTGLYGAYEGIFKETTPIENRPPEFLFVGQLIERKSVDILIDAFKAYRKNGGTWNLRLVGSGPLSPICHGDGIILENFANPYEIAKKMNNARALILPSRDDNWGTVVCEAAACGMLLITSKMVGASQDIVQDGANGIILKKINFLELQKALFSFEKMTEADFMKGSEISKKIASRYTSNGYFTAFSRIAKDLME